MDIESFKRLWNDQNALMVIDSSSLLDGYRFSSTTNQYIHNILQIEHESIFLPAQVCKEFEAGKEKVKSESLSRYKNADKELTQMIKGFKTDLSSKLATYEKSDFPSIEHLKETLFNKIDGMRDDIKNYETRIRSEVQNNQEMLDKDLPSQFISLLQQKGNIGLPLSINETIAIYEEGQLRFKYKIPPGYEDMGKSKNGDFKHQQYGDLLIWKEILQKAAECQRPFIFVTSDVKEDWWELHPKSKRPIKARVELIQEFSGVSSKGITFLSLTEAVNHLAILNGVHSLQAEVEMKTENILHELITPVIVNDNLFNKDGILTDYLENTSAVLDKIYMNADKAEVLKYSNIYLHGPSASVIEENVEIESDFELEVDASLSEYYGTEIVIDFDVTIRLLGSLKVSFELDFDRSDGDPLYKEETLHIEVTGYFEILFIRLNNVDEDSFYDEYRESLLELN
ncbi:PIN-like domain-containing protein [Priestia sp. BR_2]